MRRRDTRGAVFYTLSDLRALEALFSAGNTAGAQRIIIDKLKRAIDGPRIRTTMRPSNRRKRLVSI